MPRFAFNPMGTTVLITGASSGLGATFAREFASRGADLVLVARRLDRLEALAVDLAERYGTVSTVIPADLTEPGAVSRLVSELRERGIPIASLVNNAGFGSYGRFVSLDPDRLHREVTLNVLALTELSRALWPELLGHARRAPATGALINVASNAAFQPIPFMSVYAATKSFVLSFTEGLWYEAKGTGLKVLALCPGPTATEFKEVAENEGLFFGNPMSSQQVIDVAFRALDARSTPPRVVSGLRNAVSARGVRLLPQRSLLTVLGRFASPARRIRG